MNSGVDPITNLDDCGCCEGVSKETPSGVSNRPGLSAIAYRVGTHAQFKETMRARLSDSGDHALADLSTRAADDFSIALLDGWATVADVLTFYQERIANEAYLRTATERLSVLELARLIDYQLRPGVAASTYLAFTIEDAPGALGQALSVGTSAQASKDTLPPVTIDVGVKVQSVPGPGELPQTFETVEKIEARPEWNAVKPRLSQPQPISTATSFVIFQGTATNLKQGDRLLIRAGAGSPVVARILRVTTDDELDATRVDFVLSPTPLPRYVQPTGLAVGNVTDFAEKTPLNQSTVELVIARRWSEDDLSALAEIQGWPASKLVDNIDKQTALRVYPANGGVFAFRQRAALFGHNAPDWRTLPLAVRVGELDPSADLTNDLQFSARQLNVSDQQNAISAPPKATIGLQNFISGVFSTRQNSWADQHFAANTDTIFLDSVYPQIVPGSWIILSSTTDTRVFSVLEVAEETHTDFTLSLKVTRLKISGAGMEKFSPRNATVHVQSEQLALDDLPVEDVVKDDTVTLSGAFLGLKPLRQVILTGERDDLKGVVESEWLALKEVFLEKGFTVLTFDRSLAHSYVRKTVTINANVALATHGETVQETLGGGDATRSFQQIVLKQPPLTYISASTPSGGATTLEVRVNDVLWHEVPSLNDEGPDERVYVTRFSDDGKTIVTFGDGVSGARLPTGQDNLKAKYRKGIGLGGLVKADQLTQLMTRPFGLQGVTNPIAPSGAADPEKLADARRNAPLTVLTLGRIVSLTDYEDFARSFSGLDKALATWTWFGEQRGVFVTVAGPAGAEVREDSKLYKDLVTAMRNAGDLLVPLTVKTYQPRLFRVSLSLKIDPDYLPEKVFEAVEQELRTTFSFDSRSFGQPVHRSEVVAVAQNTRGVIAVQVTEFHRADLAVDVLQRIAAAAPRPGDDAVVAAELLTLDPRPIEFEVMS